MSVAMIEHLSNCHGEWNALIAYSIHRYVDESKIAKKTSR